MIYRTHIRVERFLTRFTTANVVQVTEDHRFAGRYSYSDNTRNTMAIWGGRDSYLRKGECAIHLYCYFLFIDLLGMQEAEISDL